GDLLPGPRSEQDRHAGRRDRAALPPVQQELRPAGEAGQGLRGLGRGVPDGGAGPDGRHAPPEHHPVGRAAPVAATPATPERGRRDALDLPRRQAPERGGPAGPALVTASSNAYHPDWRSEGGKRVGAPTPADPSVP